MSVKQDYNMDGRYAMNLWESKTYFENFFNMNPTEQKKEKETEDFKKARRQLKYWRDNEIKMRVFYREKGLIKKLKGLI